MSEDLVYVTPTADLPASDVAAKLTKAAGEDPARQGGIRLDTSGVRSRFQAPADLVKAAGLTPDQEPAPVVPVEQTPAEPPPAQVEQAPAEEATTGKSGSGKGGTK